MNQGGGRRRMNYSKEDLPSLFPGFDTGLSRCLGLGLGRACG